MKTICFYLPQYHPIPENDRWWGPGFTDWVNVARARPLFRGHRQPQVPADLGFYDLRLEESRIAQAELAARFGIAGFAYYHYWFGGKPLLERPLLDLLRSKRPDFPFTLVWANENWTRSWDGLEREVLLRQDHALYDAARHLEWLLPFLQDWRAIRIEGKPLFLVYNASAIPETARWVEACRRRAERVGVPGLYLAQVLSHRNSLNPEAAAAAGFDASVEFFPSARFPGRRTLGRSLASFVPRAWNRALRAAGAGAGAPLFPVTNVYSYRDLVERVLGAPAPPGKTFPCVMASWDNSPRRRDGATVFQNDDPALYASWLRHALARTEANRPDEQLVFINAWNEWAEGCHLEPDLEMGTRFLEATRDELARFTAREASGARSPLLEPAR